MGLLNKKDKISPISPVIESRKWVYEQYDFENAMNDDVVYHEWIDCMKINNKKNPTGRMATGILFHPAQFYPWC